eukprot:6189969-Pleurochrysis_carterae.AAC.1
MSAGSWLPRRTSATRCTRGSVLVSPRLARPPRCDATLQLIARSCSAELSGDESCAAVGMTVCCKHARLSALARAHKPLRSCSSVRRLTSSTG